MGQGGAGEWAGRCCVRGDRRERAVSGDDARDPREPAEDAERLVATPSDHYGLCVDFELARDSAQP